MCGGAAKAVISRIAGSTVSVLVARVQDKRALQNALRRTDAEHGALLHAYDVNAGFFEHEGADELARVLLPGPGPNARRLARAYHRSLGLDEAGADALVEPFGLLLEELRELLGDHERFRVALSQVAQARSGVASEIGRVPSRQQTPPGRTVGDHYPPSGHPSGPPGGSMSLTTSSIPFSNCDRWEPLDLL